VLEQLVALVQIVLHLLLPTTANAQEYNVPFRPRMVAPSANLLFANGYEATTGTGCTSTNTPWTGCSSTPGVGTVNCFNDGPDLCVGSGNPYACCTGAGEGCDGTTSTSTSNGQCDFTTDGSEPEGSEVYDEPAGGACGEHNRWTGYFGGIEDLWFTFYLKTVVAATDQGVPLLLTTGGSTTRYRFYYGNSGTAQMWADCGTSTNPQGATNLYSGGWDFYKVHIDETSGSTTVWCSGGSGCNGTSTGSTPVISCLKDGEKNSISIDGFMHACSASPTMNYRVDDLRVYDGDPG